MLNPGEIYRKSLEIIYNSLGIDDSKENRIKARAVHATGDLDVFKTIVFKNDPLNNGINALRLNRFIVTDVNMVMSGITRYNRKVCLINDDDVLLKSKMTGLSRSYLSIKKAASIYKDAIYVIGDAPTALMSLIEEVKKGLRPSLVIATPVGFVSALESKIDLLSCEIPLITNISRKGGSPMAAALMNGIIGELHA
ncbi:precorrin-8X methylmutase [Picrophilus oshimae]|uniref:Precorrin-8X methylmutase n=1 Tax=Picrophilus torridus (strain ATCC 700027 / DSM 9790 / JCM 10055 / NBRC 100828 / KAW 2/3) TaxID=1122961 RepID=A0A8G2L7U6_PICTO|nr:precorrin-8X methylmutase [Picrophilus oshimae]SMD31483.1 precorrin-8X methylmutase [Picrophilus oshimae DSM 9789]